ncbi:MAG: phosphonate ABC transporter, permease protein PhnE [Mastigocoleus sp. MO_167.B18]|nr:phosphonate ABC transporter, permease protein PhnE [Mastigocoleus sp. MO_167.B18]
MKSQTKSLESKSLSPKLKYLPPLPPRPRNLVPLYLGICLIALILMINALELSFSSLALGIKDTFEYPSRYSSPDFTGFSLYLVLMGQTLAIALWGTFIAFSASILIAPLAANNLSPHPLIYWLARELLNCLRAIPDLILALLFVSALRVGPLPGVLALGIHTTGFLGKFFAESMERVNPGIYQGLLSTGANFIQVIAFAAFPSILSEVTAYTLYIFDRNVRMATVLGLVGAGGIGLELQKNLRLFQYDSSSALILIILLSIITIDYISGWIRGRLV